MERQISELESTKLTVGPNEFLVYHIIIKTMVDGKVCNSLMNNSSAAVCYICGVSSKIMNDLEGVMARHCREDAFYFGLSTLHARIRFFECLLHISYRLDVKNDRSEELEKKRFCSRSENKISSTCFVKKWISWLIFPSKDLEQQMMVTLPAGFLQILKSLQK